MYLFSLAAIADYHKFSCLKQHIYIISQFQSRMGLAHCCALDFRSQKSYREALRRIQSICRVVQVARSQFLAVVGLRFLPSCWLSEGEATLSS